MTYDQLIIDHPLNTGAYNTSLAQDRNGFILIGCTIGLVVQQSFLT